MYTAQHQVLANKYRHWLMKTKINIAHNNVKLKLDSFTEIPFHILCHATFNVFISCWWSRMWWSSTIIVAWICGKKWRWMWCSPWIEKFGMNRYCNPCLHHGPLDGGMSAPLDDGRQEVRCRGTKIQRRPWNQSKILSSYDGKRWRGIIEQQRQSPLLLVLWGTGNRLSRQCNGNSMTGLKLSFYTWESDNMNCGTLCSWLWLRGTVWLKVQQNNFPIVSTLIVGMVFLSVPKSRKRTNTRYCSRLRNWDLRGISSCAREERTRYLKRAALASHVINLNST